MIYSIQNGIEKNIIDLCNWKFGNTILLNYVWFPSLRACISDDGGLAVMLTEPVSSILVPLWRAVLDLSQLFLWSPDCESMLCAGE